MHHNGSSVDSSSDSASIVEKTDASTTRPAEVPKGGPIPKGGAEFEQVRLEKVDLRGLLEKNKSKSVLKMDKSLQDKLNKAHAVLNLGSLPESLPCRDEEKAHIKAVLEEFFDQSTGRCLYICGVPGTGKTVSTLEVAKQYKDTGKAEFVLLNCLSMATVSDLYSALLSGLLGRHSGKKSAFVQLDKYFRETTKLTVVILDEMDVLLTKKAKELYNLFEWCWGLKRLCILGIANTVGLPERMPPAVRQRMGTDSLTFKPYTKTQMESIVRDRLGDLDVFHDMAIQRAAAKVSCANGDIRRCLKLLQNSIDVFRRPSTPAGDQVNAHHVGEAIHEMFGDDKMSDANIFDKLILASVIMAKRSVKDESTTAVDVLDRVRNSSRLSDLPPMDDAFVLKAIRDLDDVGLVQIEDRQKRLFNSVVLKVDEREVTRLVGEDNRLEWLRRTLNM